MQSSTFESGFSLVEVITATAIASILVMGISSLILLNSRMSSGYDRIHTADRVTSVVVSEFEGLPFGELPEASDCIERIFNLKGELMNQSMKSRSSCAVSGFDTTTIRVQIIGNKVESGQAEFSHKNYLKLPSDALLLMSLKIKSTIFDAKTRALKTSETVLYRRDVL